MKIAIQKIINESLQAYPIESFDGGETGREIVLNNKRIDWISNWQSQVVLTVSQIIFTKKVEGALTQNDPYKATKRLYEYACQELLQIVHKVRENMPDLTRATFASLIVLEVHSKDVIDLI